MVQAKPKLKTFGDYLAFVDSEKDEGRCELTNGELVACTTCTEMYTNGA